MQHVYVTVNSSRFVLPEDTERDSLKREMQSAVNAGGAFVDIPRAQQSPVSVLITPASFVVIYDEPDAESGASEIEGEILNDLEWTNWADF